MRLFHVAVKFVIALVGATIALGVFWVVCRLNDWQPPAWAYFVVAWIGHNDFYDALTYKRDESSL